MTKLNNPINGMNLFIMGQVFFLFIALLLAPFLALALSSIVCATAWSYCTSTAFSPLPRAGSLIQGIAFLYVVAEEVWNLTGNVGSAIEANFADLHADEQPSSKPALEKYRTIAAWTLIAHKVFRRGVEGTLIIGGTIINAAGDLIAARFSEVMGIH